MKTLKTEYHTYNQRLNQVSRYYMPWWVIYLLETVGGMQLLLIKGCKVTPQHVTAFSVCIIILHLPEVINQLKRGEWFSDL